MAANRMSDKLCELKIKDMSSVHSITAALLLNGYDIQTSPVYKEWPKSGIDYFAVRIGEYPDGGKDDGR